MKIVPTFSWQLMKHLSKSSWRLYILALFAGISSVAMYLPTIEVNYFADDVLNIAFFRESSLIGVFSELLKPHGDSGFYRPLFNMSHALEHLLWGNWPAGYHLTNVIIHAICTCLIFLIAAHMWPDELLIAVFSGLLFGLHPIHVGAVTWISSRGDLLSTLFALSCFYFTIKWIHKDKIALGIVASLCFLLALMSKETSIAIMLVIILYVVIANRSFVRASTLSASLILILSLSLLSVYFFVRLVIIGSQTIPRIGYNPLEMLKSIGFENLFSMALLEIGKWNSAFLLPVGSIVSPERHTLWGILGLCALYTVFAYAAWIRDTRLVWLLIWSLFTILPVSHVLANAIPGTGGDRYFYLPSAGMSLLLGCLLGRPLAKLFYFGRAGMLLTLVIICALVGSATMLTQQRLQPWKTASPIMDRIIRTVSAHVDDDPSRAEVLFDGLPQEFPGRITAFFNIGTLVNAVTLHLDVPYIHAQQWREVDLLGANQVEIPDGAFAFSYRDGEFFDLQETWLSWLDFRARQGYRGWRYLAGQPGHYAQLPLWDPEVSWWRTYEGYPFIGIDKMHPGSDSQAAIRRWISPRSGWASIKVEVADLDASCGDGVLVELRHEATVLRRLYLANGAIGDQPLVSSVNIQEGEVLDVLVWPGNDAACDTTQVRGMIHLPYQ